MDNNVIMELLGCIAIIAVFFWYLIYWMRKGPIYATIYYKDGTVTQVSRIFNNFTEYNEWVDEVLHIAETCNTEDDAIDYIEYSFIDPLNKK